ncbi:MAG: hypothetical protein JO079_06500 [Frankiaceae bacterium]|nr:hypothetical protein [Frankiaceae bacterium]
MDAAVDLNQNFAAVGTAKPSVEVAPRSSGPVAMLEAGFRQAMATAEREKLDLGQRLGAAREVGQQPAQNWRVADTAGFVQRADQAVRPGPPLLYRGDQHPRGRLRVRCPCARIDDPAVNIGDAHPAEVKNIPRPQPARLVDHDMNACDGTRSGALCDEEMHRVVCEASDAPELDGGESG